MIKSNLVVPGTKLLVTADTKYSSIPPHSSIYMSYLHSFDKHRPNYPTVDITVIRRGKRGKQRIENQVVHTLTFFTEKEEKIVSGIFGTGHNINYIRAVTSYSNISNMNGIEFLGWASAYVRYLSKVHHNCDGAISWPASKQNPLNICLHTVPLRFHEKPEETLELFGNNQEFRNLFMESARNFEASMFRSALTYRYGVAECELLAIANLTRSYAIANKKDKPYDVKELATLYDFHAKKFLKMQELAYRVDNKRHKAFSTSEGEGISNPPSYGFDVRVFKALLNEMETHKDLFSNPGSVPPVFAYKQKEPKVNKKDSLSSFLV